MNAYDEIVLYGNAEAHARAELWDPTGLAAVVPHVANLRTTSGGGGGYGTAAVGGGSAPGDASGQAVGGNTGSGFRPIGRNTSVYESTVRGARRLVRTQYQHSAQGPRVAPSWGLGATVPHVANLRTTSGGGGSYGVAAVGGGSAPGDVSGQAVGGSAGTGFRPIGRNTSVYEGAAGPTRRFVRTQYQHSAQGPRSAPSWGRSAGMADAGLGWDFFDWLKTRFRRRRRSRPAPARVEPDPMPRLGEHLGDPFGWIKDRLTPPGGNILRIQPIPVQIRNLIPTPVRTAVRYAGAAQQTFMLPFLTGSAQRRVFGLSPAESRVFMKGQQVSRIVSAVVVTGGLAKVGPAAFAATPTGSATVGAQSLTPAQYASVVGPGNTLTAASSSTPYMTVAPPVTELTGTKFATAAAFSSTPAGSAAPVTAGLSLPWEPGFTAAAKAGAAAAPQPGIASQLAKGALEAGKFVGKTAVQTAASVAVAQATMPRGGAGGETVAELPYGAPVYSSAPAEQLPEAPALPWGGGSSSGAAGEALEPMLAGSSLPLTMAAAGVGLLILARARRQRRTA